MAKTFPSGLFLTGALLAPACDNGQNIVEEVSAAVATGAVRDAQGMGLSGATVRGSFCESPNLDEWQTQTAASGEYDLLMNTFSGLDLVRCIALVAEAQPGAGLSPDTVRLEGVLFTSAVPLDTARIDFVLEP